MQAIQPKLKLIQAKYASNPEVLQRELSNLYQENDVNPLAGCLPALFQIPVFIGLYRALLKLTSENLLNEPFLWLPNLEGPVYGATTSDWLFKGWVDGVPSLGWHDTLCFLSLPAILILLQSISQRLLQPPPDPVRNAQHHTSYHQRVVTGAH
jgi:YidC/Oxa1 family membrane protein insertase